MRNELRIGDICDVFDGPHATPKKVSTGPIYLGIDAITDDGRLNPSEYNHLSDSDYKKWTKRVTPRKDDIVFSYEATLGRYAMIPEGFHGCLGRRLGIVRVTDGRINPHWLYYYFLSPEWGAFISNHTVKGSTVNRISVDDFPDYQIPLLNKETQDNIVAILKPIDDLIDNNNSLCSNLEAQAKALYDYWFTQYDFPNAEGKPYRASGGVMVWNEQLKREIPKGWEVGILSDIANIVMGQSPDGSTYNEEQNGIVFYQGCTDFGTRFPYPRVFTTSPTRFAKAGDILISVRAPVGTLNVAMEDCCIGRGLAALDSKIGSQLHLFYTLSSFKKAFDVMDGNGTTFGSVTKDTLYEFRVIIPKMEIIEQFEQIVKPIEQQIRTLEQENRELTKLRDWLLPMLINGQAVVE